MPALSTETKRNIMETPWARRTRANNIPLPRAVRKGLAIALVLLACAPFGGAFAAAAPEIPDIDPSEANIQARAIQSQEDALAYAQVLWASAYLHQDTDGLVWSVEENKGVYYVTAGEEASQLSVHFGSDGIVNYLYNGMSGFSDARLAQENRFDEHQEALADYLLSFVDALQPGDADGIEAFHGQEETAYADSRYVTLLGYTFGGDGEKDDTYSIFVIEILPELRVVNYATGIPLSTLNSGVG